MKEKVYIVGAHSRAQTLAVYLQALYPGLTVAAYLYNNHEPNPEKIGNVPVINLNAHPVLCTNYPVYIGTRGVYHENLLHALNNIGFTEIYPVNPELDQNLRNAYLQQLFASKGRDFVKIDDLAAFKGRTALGKLSAVVYVAKSIFDKPLKQNYELAPYEKEIWAGAELANNSFSTKVLEDNKGDHISEKNRQFCELTALYWIWKHTCEDIVGFAHYRRHFILPTDWAERMQWHGIDVVLPVPLYVTPNVADNFKKRHDSQDWEFMMECLKKTNRAMYQKANIFFSKNLYVPCNMFLMQRCVLNELCEWLFPILFQVAEYGGQREDIYRNRYPAFLSERLITLFFGYHREKYRVVYADKNFLM